MNTAATAGNPTNADGSDIPNVDNPTDSDTARVNVVSAIGDFVWLDTNANGIQDVVNFIRNRERNELTVTRRVETVKPAEEEDLYTLFRA